MLIQVKKNDYSIAIKYLVFYILSVFLFMLFISTQTNSIWLLKEFVDVRLQAIGLLSDTTLLYDRSGYRAH